MSEADPSRKESEKARALAELEELTGFHISLANVAIKLHFLKHHHALRLTQKQIAILWLVDSCPGLIQIEIAQMLGVQRATISAIVGLLCRRGLLDRLGPGDADRRHMTLGLTAEGKAALVEAKRAIRSHEKWVQSHFDKKELRAIAELMGRVYR